MSRRAAFLTRSLSFAFCMPDDSVNKSASMSLHFTPCFLSLLDSTCFSIVSSMFLSIAFGFCCRQLCEQYFCAVKFASLDFALDITRPQQWQNFCNEEDDDMSSSDSEDEDFVPDNKALSGESEDEVADEEPIAKPVEKSTTTDVDALWKQMNDPAPVVDTSTTQKTVEIDRTYTFAGEVHHEKKTVLADSQEAKDFAMSKTKTQTEVKPGLRKVMKRKSTLEETHGKPKKLNTLEKSRMEWSGFIDKEGIAEDLKRGNKNGYLDKQDFLSRTRK